MLIPMISFRSREGLFTAPICFKDPAEAARIIPDAVAPRDPSELFDMAVLAAEFNPETGDVFAVGEDISHEFNFLSAGDPVESEVINEESSFQESISEEIPSRL